MAYFANPIDIDAVQARMSSLNECGVVKFRMKAFEDGAPTYWFSLEKGGQLEPALDLTAAPKGYLRDVQARVMIDAKQYLAYNVPLQEEDLPSEENDFPYFRELSGKLVDVIVIDSWAAFEETATRHILIGIPHWSMGNRVDHWLNNYHNTTNIPGPDFSFPFGP